MWCGVGPAGYWLYKCVGRGSMAGQLIYVSVLS